MSAAFMSTGGPLRALLIRAGAEGQDHLRAPALDAAQGWVVELAADPQAALTTLAKRPAEVVIWTQGTFAREEREFAARLAQEYSRTTRVVLAGAPTDAAASKAQTLAHRVLAVNLDREALGQALLRTVRLRRMLDDPGVSKLGASIGDLPPPPRAYWELGEALVRGETAPAVLAAILESDPRLGPRILALANSTLVGITRRMPSLAQALEPIGPEIARGLTLAAHVFACLEERNARGIALAPFCSLALRMARLARRFLTEPPRADEAFSIGLVHDLGRCVLAVQKPAELAAISNLASAEGVPRHEAERYVLGVSHAELGAWILDAWMLPFSWVECVAFHHSPGQIAPGPMELIAAVHAADVLLGAREYGEPRRSLDLQFLLRAGLEDRVREWRALAAQEAA